MSAKNISDAEILMDIGIDHKIALTLEWEEQKIVMAEFARLRAELEKARKAMLSAANKLELLPAYSAPLAILNAALAPAASGGKEPK